MSVEEDYAEQEKVERLAKTASSQFWSKKGWMRDKKEELDRTHLELWDNADLANRLEIMRLFLTMTLAELEIEMKRYIRVNCS